MLKHFVFIPLLGAFFKTMCLSASPFDSQPTVSAAPSNGWMRNQASGREEIVEMDERDEDIHQRANRRGDWSFKQNWRYDRKAFYNGETQPEAYNREHSEGLGGIGFDSDNEFLQMRRFYEEEAARNQHNIAQNQKYTTSSRQNVRYHGNSGYSDARTYAYPRSDFASREGGRSQEIASRFNTSYPTNYSYPMDDNFRYDWSKQNREFNMPSTQNPQPYYYNDYPPALYGYPQNGYFPNGEF